MKFNNNSSSNHEHKRPFPARHAEHKPFNNNPAVTSLGKVKPGDYFKGVVQILRRAVPGPVILTVFDGEKSVDAVTKDTPFQEDEVVLLLGPVSERAGRLQIEIDRIEKASEDFATIIEQKANPIRTDTSIVSARYAKMLPHFIEAAKLIRKAVIKNQPILIRHHNDSDGINAGHAIEIACKGFMKRIGINPDYNLYRSPSKAPFYETADVFRDLVLAKRLTEGHGQKNPLLLVLDNGSTPEDSFGLKTIKMVGYEAIVIDHHNPVEYSNGKSSVCPYLTYHVNPYLYGLDSKTSAGMICYEIARMIDEEFEMPLMPAVAAISDRCDIPETEEYIKKSGKTRQELTAIGVAIDFMAYQLKFDSGKGVVEEIYHNPEFVKLINEEVQQGVETQLQSTLPYLRTMVINGVTFSYIDLEKYTLRFTYPTPGKVIGMIHDKVAEGKEQAPVISLGYVSDMIIIRATKPILPVQKIIENLQHDMPEANIDGGGHEMAGTIKFVPAHLSAILEHIKQQVRHLKLQDTE